MIGQGRPLSGTSSVSSGFTYINAYERLGPLTVKTSLPMNDRTQRPTCDSDISLSEFVQASSCSVMLDGERRQVTDSWTTVQKDVKSDSQRLEHGY